MSFILLLVTGLFKTLNAVPPDYCYPRINLNDCELPPTPVFTYYKPGSRCEIELWRGCPTLNKFENEFECSHTCIGRLNPAFSAEDNEIGGSEEPSEQCKELINLDDCGREEEEVFTFDAKQGHCVAVQWKGCETDNKFVDKESCKAACKHLLQEESESASEETKEEKEATEKSESEAGSGGEKKTSEEQKTADEAKKAANTDKDEGGPEKLKKTEDEGDGDPEETQSVRRRKMGLKMKSAKNSKGKKTVDIQHNNL